MNTTKQTPIAEINFDHVEKVLHIKVTDGADLNLENIIKHNEILKTIVGLDPYLVLIDASNFYTIEKEAWEYATLKEVIANRKAIAHYNSSFANRLITNMFTKMYKTSVPIKIFKTKEEALIWLKSFSINN